MRKPEVGFSMHPRWAFAQALLGFLGPLREAGLRALEFELWDRDPDWPRFLPLMENCQRLGFRLCFHAPYRPPYSIAGFAGERRAEIEAAYAPMLDVAARFPPASLVVHGAWSETRPHDALRADTVAFLRWVLERYPGLMPALENVVPDPRRIKIGTTRVEVLEIVEEVGNQRLGICWDMGHDVKAGRLDTPPAAWLSRVVHVHLHDIDGRGVDHYPLLYGQVPYPVWLPALLRSGFDGIVTLEIKGNQLAHLGVERITRVLLHSITEVARSLETPTEAACF